MREGLLEIFALEVSVEEDDALALVQRQQEVVVGADVDRFELGGGDVELFERQLYVCKCQLAQRRLADAGKRVERGEFVVEHGCLELLIAFAELLREFFGLVQLQLKYQLVVTSFEASQTLLLLCYESAHPFAYIFDGGLGGLLGRCPARQAVAFVCVNFGHQCFGCFVDVLDGDLAGNVDL